MDTPKRGADATTERLVRLCLVLVLGAGSAWAWSRYGAAVLERTDRALYPPIRGAPNVLSITIEEETLRRKRNSFAINFRRVFAMIEAARGEGINVARFEPMMTRANRMAQDGQFELARRYLNSIEVQIPRRPQGAVRPVGDGDLGSNPEPPPARVGRTRRRR